MLYGFGTLVYIKNGYIQRFDIPHYIQEINNDIQEAKKTCADIHPEWGQLGYNPCAFSKEEEKNTVVIIGDSHAFRLFTGLIKNNDLGFASFSLSASPPYIDIMSYSRFSDHKSRKSTMIMMNKYYEYILNNNMITTVILVHNPIYSFFDIIDMQNTNIDDRDIVLANGMRRTFNLLIDNNKKIIVVLDNPILPFEPSKCLKRNLQFFKYDNMCKFDRNQHEKNHAQNWYNNILFNVLKDYPNIKIFDVSNFLCDESYCYASKNGNVFYTDRDHLSIEGALYVADALLKLIKE